VNPISCAIPSAPPACQLDILGALTQTGITQTAAGGKARAFCDIVGDQLGTMETNEFPRSRFPRGVTVTDLQAFADSAHAVPAGKLCATHPNSYIV
jgi:hypothetical protein